jgi:hypothetical protein
MCSAENLILQAERSRFNQLFNDGVIAVSRLEQRRLRSRRQYRRHCHSIPPAGRQQASHHVIAMIAFGAQERPDPDLAIALVEIAGQPDAQAFLANSCGIGSGAEIDAEQADTYDKLEATRPISPRSMCVTMKPCWTAVLDTLIWPKNGTRIWTAWAPTRADLERR